MEDQVIEPKGAFGFLIVQGLGEDGKNHFALQISNIERDLTFKTDWVQESPEVDFNAMLPRMRALYETFKENS